MTIDFHKEIWEGFDQKTNYGKTPFLFQSVLPLNEGFSNHETVKNAFYNLCSKSNLLKTDCRLRIYDGEKRRDDLVEKLSSETILSDETLIHFMQRLSGKERFSLVINNLEQSCPKLAADFGLFAQSFFDYKGIPIGGIEQATFCGNYSGTAFGIHEGFEHAFLCHLGPGIKYFYCWSRELYLEITGSREPTFSDSELYDKLIEKGTLYILKPGDALYLPASVYHVGRQEEFSVSIALPFYTYPLSRFMALKILPALSEQSLPFDQEGMSELIKFDNNQFDIEPLSTLLTETINKWLQQDLPKYLHYYWHRLRSNGGWELPTTISADPLKEPEHQNDLIINPDSQVSLQAPFIVSYEHGLDCSSDEIRVFIATKSVILPASSETLKLLDTLNTRQPITIHSEEVYTSLKILIGTGGLFCH
ncbi:cupin domain-containing protein [Xenorhabdus bovienii]|nr:cupin domain-containing protein [Xenorhabdus bovienii]